MVRQLELQIYLKELNETKVTIELGVGISRFFLLYLKILLLLVVHLIVYTKKPVACVRLIMKIIKKKNLFTQNRNKGWC